MILAGDEFLRTQRGNNNAWCQDNAIGWVNWKLAEENADFLRFTRMMIAMRKSHAVFRRRTFLTGGRDGSPVDITWHGIFPYHADWNPWSRSLAFTLHGDAVDRSGERDRDFYVAMNAGGEPLRFRIPEAPSGRAWRRRVDTSLASPEDIVELDAGPMIAPSTLYAVESHSLIILTSVG